MTVVFDRPVVPIVIGQEQDDLPAPIAINPPVEGDGEWVNTFIYTFTPVDLGFAPATTYTISVDTDLTAQDGTQLQEGFVWSFTTASPELSYVTPRDERVDIPLDVELEMRFTAGVDREALEAAFSLVPVDDEDAATGDAISGTFEWLEDGRWFVTFIPDEFLANETTYVARLDNDIFSEMAGFELAGQLEWRFSTLPYPQLMSTEPTDGTENSNYYSGFSLIFNTYMDSDSITERVTITPPPESLSGYRSGYSYRGTFNAEGRTTYNVRIEPGIKDIYGNIYDEPIEFTYTTSPLPPFVRLRIPLGPVGFYNAYNDFTGLFVQHRNVESLDMRLYGLDVEQFVTLLLERDREQPSIYNYPLESDALIHRWEVSLDDSIPDTIQPSLLTLGAGEGCEGVDLTFNPGDVVTVTGEDPVEILETWIDGPLVLTLYPGFEAQVTGGAICTDTGVWWQVEVANRQGWVDGAQLEFVAASESDEIAVSAADGGKLNPGIYTLRVSIQEPEFNNPIARSHNLIVSTAVVTLKHSYDGLVVWATDVHTAEPIADAPVTIYSEDAEVIAVGLTDADGLLRVPAAAVNNLTQDRRVAVVQSDTHFGVGMSGWAEGIDPGMFEQYARFSNEDYEAAIYLDRQAYRPGETVYYRGFVRYKDDMTYTVPTEFSSIDIGFSNGQEVIHQDATLTPYGTFSGSFEIVDDARVGGGYYVFAERYNRQTEDSNRRRLFSETAYFSIAEFRLPEFEVLMTPEQDDIANGDDLRVAIEGAYYFGGPVANSDVNYSIIANPLYFNYTGDQGSFRFYQPWQDPAVPDSERNSFRQSRQVATGEGNAAGGGIYLLDIAADLGEFPGSQRFDIEATVRDVSDQSVSNRTSVNIHAGDYYIGTDVERYLSRVGEDTTVNMILVDWDSLGISDQDITVEVYQREWFSVQKRDPVTGYTEWEYETGGYTGRRRLREH